MLSIITTNSASPMAAYARDSRRFDLRTRTSKGSEPTPPDAGSLLSLSFILDRISGGDWFAMASSVICAAAARRKELGVKIRGQLFDGARQSWSGPRQLGAAAGREEPAIFNGG